MYKAMELWEDMAPPGSCKHIRMAAVQRAWGMARQRVDTLPGRDGV